MHLLLALAVLATLSTAPASEPLELDTETPPPPAADVTIDSASPAWTELVEWGVARFRAAGLELPALEVSVHADKGPCDGNGGLYQPGPTPRVRLCSAGRPDARAVKLLTLHELAHAWAEARLSEETRAALLELRGLEAWVDPALPPHEWGAEHAAEILSWGLMDEEVRIIRIYDAEPAQLEAGFELLVGARPMWV